MPPKPVIAFYGLWPDLYTYARKKVRGGTVTWHSEPITVHNIDPSTTILAIFTDSMITADIIRALPKLTYIAAMSTGYDHIELKTANQHSITVSNVPTYGENTVAEHTFALILGLTRKLFQSIKRVKEGRYDFHGLCGTDLKDKTLGIIGAGHIGAHVARMAQGFEMKVLAYDPKPNRELAARIGFNYVALSKLLKQSDIVTLHAPLIPANYHLINAKNIVLMKKSSLLINTARGALIDPQALLEALNSGQLAGAGLDVLEEENLLQPFKELAHRPGRADKIKTSLINNLLIDHPNTIITPHNAFNSDEALQRIVDVTAENIAAFIKGQAINVVAP